MKRRLALLVTLSIAVVGAAAAFAQERDAGPDAARSPEEERRRAQVVTRVGDVRITVGDLEDRIAEQSPFVRGRYNDPSQRRELLDNLIRFELLAKEAKRRGYDRDPEVVQAVKQVAVQELIRREFDERIRPDTIPAEDVRSNYEKNGAEFHRPEMRRISQIILESREAANRILEKARTADARAFRQLAQEHSTDRETKLRGGDVRYFPQTSERRPEDPEVPEPIVRAAFAIENIGDVAPQPVDLSGRWAIVKLTGRRPSEHRTLEQAEPSIRNRLWRERRQSTIDEFVADLRRRANVQVHEELLNLIVLAADDSSEHIPGLGSPPGTPRVRGPQGPRPGAVGGGRPAPGPGSRPPASPH